MPTCERESLMDWRPWALVGLGGLAILEAANRGAPWTGGAPAAKWLFRAGIIYLVFGAVTARVRPMTVRRAVWSAIGALAVAALVGFPTLYHARVVTPPHEPLGGVLLREAVYALVLSPIPAGYVAGVLAREGRPGRAASLLLGTTFVGGFGTVHMLGLVLGNGTGLGAALLVATSFVAGGAALPALVIMSRRADVQGPTPGE